MRFSFRCPEAGSMSSSLKLPLLIRPLQAAAILVFGALLAPHRATAEIILDDFDDSAMVVSPEMEGDLIVTDNVGALGATRTLSI
jgi:hypothetical protein